MAAECVNLGRELPITRSHSITSPRHRPHLVLGVQDKRGHRPVL